MNRTRPATSHLLACGLIAACVLPAGCLLLTGCGRKGSGAGPSASRAAGSPGADASNSGSGAPGAASGSAASGRGAAERDPGAVAQVGAMAIPYKAFERYLNDNAGEDTDDGEELDTIKSRLLDQFIEEQLLLSVAPDLKIAVSDAEVDSYYKELGLTQGDLEVTAPDGTAAFRERIKNGLIVQKVKEAAVLTKVQVSQGEVDDALKARPDLTRAASQLVLRQILLDDRKAADEVRRKLEADPTQFEALAKERSAAPDKGQPRSYAEEDLPTDLRNAVRPLEPGQVSPVLEHAQAFLIFQLVRKVESRTSDLAEVRHRVESDLMRQKADQVMEAYLADLKEKTEIHVNRAILPFQYVGEFHN